MRSLEFLQGIQSVFDEAFTRDISAPAVGLLIALVTGIRRERMDALQNPSTLEQLGAIAPGSRALGAVVVAGSLGPELAYQVMQ